MDVTKRCNRCGAEKPHSEFYTNGKKGNLRPECKPCNRTARKKYQRENTEKPRAWKLKAKYNLTIEQWDSLLASQGGTCALCERTTADKLGRPLHVDHDHETGVIRGLLCSDHNTGIGKLGDTLEGVLAAAEYLRASFDRC